MDDGGLTWEWGTIAEEEVEVEVEVEVKEEEEMDGTVDVIIKLHNSHKTVEVERPICGFNSILRIASIAPDVRTIAEQMNRLVLS